MRPSTAAAKGAISPRLLVKKQQTTPVKNTTPNTTSKAEKVKPSSQYQKKGLSSDRIELEHLRTIVTELRRDQQVVESIKSDNNLLRE